MTHDVVLTRVRTLDLVLQERLDSKAVEVAAESVAAGCGPGAAVISSFRSNSPIGAQSRCAPCPPRHAAERLFDRRVEAAAKLDAGGIDQSHPLSARRPPGTRSRLRSRRNHPELRSCR